MPLLPELFLRIFVLAAKVLIIRVYSGIIVSNNKFHEISLANPPAMIG
jgi:hypothetical protein